MTELNTFRGVSEIQIKTKSGWVDAVISNRLSSVVHGNCTAIFVSLPDGTVQMIEDHTIETIRMKS